MQSNRMKEEHREQSAYRRPWFAWLVLVCLLLPLPFSACQCDTRAKCDTSSTCPDGTPKCVAGYCFKPCTGDAECASGESCKVGLCVDPGSEIGGVESSTEVPADTSDTEPVTDKGTNEPVTQPDEPNVTNETRVDAGEPQTPDSSAPKDDDQEQVGDKSNTERKTDADATDAGPQDRGFCNPGDKRTCYSGFPGSEGTGTCKAGEQVCGSSGQWEACKGEIVPVRETCDGKDDDCDGKTDEDFPQLDKPCAVSQGECAGTGVYKCTSDGKSLYCLVQGKQSSPEVCDGKDNDCDGLVDEGFADLGKPCFDGKGACRRQGAIVCSADGSKTECTAKAGPSYPERCNGRDDDCDGQVDEDFTTLGKACTVGKGICANTGKLVCNQAGSDVTCDVTPGQPQQETCNGQDDDCDGQVDNGVPPRPCANQRGACAGSTTRCLLGTYAKCTIADYTSNNPKYELKEASCDGVDNDCNGTVDDQFTTLGNKCTPAQCKLTGTIICDPNNATKTTCDVLTRKEICANATDDNCDGTIDEGCPPCVPQTSQYCYPGPAGTDGIGQCYGSSQQCLQTKVWGSCAEWSGPSTQQCGSYRDNDCDGLIDEGCSGCPFLVSTKTYFTRMPPQMLAVAGNESAISIAQSNGAALDYALYSFKVLYTLGGTTASGHTGKIFAVARHFSSTYTGGEDNSIRKWRSGKESYVILGSSTNGHKGDVTALAVFVDFPDGNEKYLVSGSADKTIKLWEASTGKHVQTISGAHTTTVGKLAFDLRYKWMASADGTRALLFDTATWKVKATLGGCKKAITDLVFSPPGQHVAAACDGVIRVWDLTAFPTITAANFTLPTSASARTATSVEISADGSWVWAGTSDGEIVQFDRKTGKAERTYANAHSGAVTDLQRTNYKGYLVSIGTDGKMRVWTCASYYTATQSCLPGVAPRVMTAHTNTTLTHALFSRYGESFFTTAVDKTIKQWDSKTLNLMGTMTGHTSTVNELAISPKGDKLVSASSDGTVRIWELPSRKLLHTVTVTNVKSGKIVFLGTVAYHPNEDLVITAGSDGILYEINTATGKITGSSANITSHTGAIYTVGYSLNGFYIASGGADGSVFLWRRNTTGFTTFRNWVAHSAVGVFRLKWLRKSYNLVTIPGGPGAPVAWSTTGKVYRNFSVQSQLPLSSIAIGQTDALVAFGSQDGAVYFANVSNGAVVKTIPPAGQGLAGTRAMDWDFLSQTFLYATFDGKVTLQGCVVVQ